MALSMKVILNTLFLNWRDCGVWKILFLKLSSYFGCVFVICFFFFIVHFLTIILQNYPGFIFVKNYHTLCSDLW